MLAQSYAGIRLARETFTMMKVAFEQQCPALHFTATEDLTRKMDEAARKTQSPIIVF
jgi:hypothetical protein